jgi:hypothetical protein
MKTYRKNEDGTVTEIQQVETPVDIEKIKNKLAMLIIEKQGILDYAQEQVLSIDLQIQQLQTDIAEIEKMTKKKP